MDYFLTYAGSVSFRELKNAIKKYFFLNLGGVGAKTRFLSKKDWGRILGQLALYTWVVRCLDIYPKKVIFLGHGGTLPGPFLPRVLRN